MPRSQNPVGPSEEFDFYIDSIEQITFNWSGRPAAGAVSHQPLISNYRIPAKMTLGPIAGGGSATVWANTAPTSTAVFTLNYIRPSVSTTPVLIGTITLTAGSKFLISAVTAIAELTMQVGDILQLVAPATQDATMADVSVAVPAFAY